MDRDLPAWIVLQSLRLVLGHKCIMPYNNLAFGQLIMQVLQYGLCRQGGRDLHGGS